MVEFLIHQSFWVLFSFLLFYFLMHKFFFKKVRNILNLRSVKFQNIQKEIEYINLNIDKMNDEIEYIEQYELPRKYMEYIKINSEAIIQELDLQLKQYKDELKSSLEVDLRDSSNKIDINKINSIAHDLIKRIQ